MNCPYNANYRTARHQHVVDNVVELIDAKRRPRPVFKCFGNLKDGGGRPDIEFLIDGKLWILDVVYSTDAVLE